MDLSTNSYNKQYKDLIELLIKQVQDQQIIINDQKHRLANIQYILNAKVTVLKEGKIESHESRE